MSKLKWLSTKRIFNQQFGKKRTPITGTTKRVRKKRDLILETHRNERLCIYLNVAVGIGLTKIYLLLSIDFYIRKLQSLHSCQIFHGFAQLNADVSHSRSVFPSPTDSLKCPTHLSKYFNKLPRITLCPINDTLSHALILLQKTTAVRRS